MNDTVSNLYARKRAIQNQKLQLKKEMREKIEKLDKSLEDIEKALEVINETVKNVLCPACEGTGTTQYADAAGAMDDKPCAACSGTGIKIKENHLDRKGDETHGNNQ